ncbi:MAG: hypothetical protein RLZZ242_600 [Bacteroidota bacterium]
MILIYTHKITPRLRFVIRHLFRRIMGATYEITDSVDAFVKHAGPKLTYAKQPLQSEFFIRANSLLFERNIEPQDIYWKNWDDVPCFFEVDARSTIPFDVFAASFFLLSRYEEYLPHQKDEWGRFRAIESVLSDRQEAMKRPLVDLWALKLKHVIQEAFPDTVFNERAYEVKVVLPVVASHKFKFRSLSRHVFESAVDLVQLKFGEVKDRLTTLVFFRTDPFDHYLETKAKLDERQVELLLFFQFSRYDMKDRNVSWSKSKFGFFLKHMNDYLEIGYCRSRFALDEPEVFKSEFRKLQQLLHRPIRRTVMANNRILLPNAYQELVQEEVQEDYSMGYTDVIGFRAGTCTPFPFYDLGLEIEQPLRVYPVCVSHTSLERFDKETIASQLSQLAAQVRAVQGTLCAQFSNEYIERIGEKAFADIIETLTR